MLFLKAIGEFYIDETTPLRSLNRDFEGLFVCEKRIFKRCRCRKELLVFGRHEVILKQVGNFFEVLRNV